MSNWSQYVTGSVTIIPITPGSPLPQLPPNWPTVLFTTGTMSWIINENDRTGQLVRDGKGPVWLVKETKGLVHTLVNEQNEEETVTEGRFDSWGTWRRVSG